MKRAFIILIQFAFGYAALAQNTSNLTTFTPSALLGKGQYEIQSFNNIYSQNSVRDATGEEVQLNERQIFLSSMLMFTYGVSPNANSTWDWT